MDKVFDKVRSEQGSALLPVIIILILVVVLAATGLMRVQPQVKRNKLNEAANLLSGNVDAIISWSAARKCVPSDTDFPNAVRNPTDVWGKPLVYIYDDALSTLSTGSCTGVCAFNPASASVINTTPALSGRIAFIIISGGADYRLQSKINGTVVTTKGVAGPAASDVTLDPLDVYKVVTLSELQNKMGCYNSSQQGRLQILNTQLPTACLDLSYNASVIIIGGIAPYTATITGTPSWLAYNCGGGSCSSPFTGYINFTSTKAGPGTGTEVAIAVTDSNLNTVTMAFALNVNTLCTTPTPASSPTPTSSPTPAPG
ncbi:MAG: hypothetical protein HQK89_06385 [Nitrospirae bacterium]|nr:hypothetical protein [Nitrospirota bacterium]